MPEITLIILKQLSLGGMYCPIIQDDNAHSRKQEMLEVFMTDIASTKLELTKIIAGTSCLDVITMKCQYFSYIQCFICFAADLYILVI